MFNGEQFAVYAGYLKCSLEKEREIPFYAIWTKGVEVKGICANSRDFQI